MDKSKLENYIKQTIEYLKEDALNAKQEYLNSTEERKKLFNDGVLMGYYHAINTLRQQAENFQISLKDLNLEDIDPDKDLLS
jgi:hypothetical protein